MTGESTVDVVGMLAERRAVQRRSTLRALGLGVTAMAVESVATEAKKKRGRKRAKNRCPRQVAPCEAAFTDYCRSWGYQEECLATVRECCASLNTCDAGKAMDCFVFRFLIL
jgi:hypothetical protein